jgi:hypothetical protein
VEILLWLAVPLGVTALASLWAVWAGRRAGRQDRRRDDDAVAARFSAALTRPVPEAARHVVRQVPERPSGVAVRLSQKAVRDAGAPAHPAE